VKNIFNVEPMQKIKVKGKSEPQQIYAVLGRKDDPSAPKTLEDMRKLVGIDMKGKCTEEVGDEGEVKYEIIEG
jgi:adenylate cyclase